MGGLVQRQAESGDEERDREDDADVEQVDQAVERVPSSVAYRAVSAESGAASHLPASGSGGTARSRAVRSSVYMRVRVSVSANATVPTSSPMVVAANAVRRSVASVATAPRPSAARPGASGISV